MKKINVFELYSFGKNVASLAKLPNENAALKSVGWILYQAKSALTKQLLLDSILLPASRRAASDLTLTIDDVIPGMDAVNLLTGDGDKEIPAYKFYYIRNALEKLEAVLGADMPGIASYVVAQKGIYKTEDLIDNAIAHLPKDVIASISQQACVDVKEAGRCLAFELCTASSFHMWRAVESVMCQYYEVITGQSPEECGVAKNWNSYIKALITKGAESKITAFLDHIREEYRNPITHPDIIVNLEDALNLFSAACSAINQMAIQIKKLSEGGKQLSFNPQAIALPAS